MGWSVLEVGKADTAITGRELLLEVRGIGLTLKLQETVAGNVEMLVLELEREWYWCRILGEANNCL